MLSVEILIMLFISVNCVDANEISCEEFSPTRWSCFRMGLHTCHMETSTSVDSANIKISNSDTSVHGLSFSKNRNIFYLPVNVAINFPNLQGYGAICETNLRNFYQGNFQRQL